MFCNHCGAQLQADQRFCGSCGKTAAPTPAPAGGASVPSAARSASGRLARHLRTLAIFWIAFSALRVLKGFGGLIGARMMTRMMHSAGDAWFGGGWPIPDFVPRILPVFGIGSLLVAAVGFAAGWGLLEHRPWARTLVIVLAVLALFNPLLGTALGAYTLWVLLPAPAEEEWRRMAGGR